MFAIQFVSLETKGIKMEIENFLDSQNLVTPGGDDVLKYQSIDDSVSAPVSGSFENVTIKEDTILGVLKEKFPDLEFSKSRVLNNKEILKTTSSLSYPISPTSNLLKLTSLVFAFLIRDNDTLNNNPRPDSSLIF